MTLDKKINIGVIGHHSENSLVKIGRAIAASNSYPLHCIIIIQSREIHYENLEKLAEELKDSLKYRELPEPIKNNEPFYAPFIKRSKKDYQKL